MRNLAPRLQTALHFVAERHLDSAHAWVISMYICASSPWCAVIVCAVLTPNPAASQALSSARARMVNQLLPTSVLWLLVQISMQT